MGIKTLNSCFVLQQTFLFQKNVNTHGSGNNNATTLKIKPEVSNTIFSYFLYSKIFIIWTRHRTQNLEASIFVLKNIVLKL